MKEKFKNIQDKDNKIKKIQKLIGIKSVNSADKFGLTPLSKAVLEENSVDIAKMLIFLSATTNKNIKLKKGMGSYMHLSQYSDSPLKWLKFFYENGGNIEAETSFKETPLFYAVYNKNMESIKFLINKGCNINHQDIYKETIMFKILREGNVKYFKYFISKMPNIEDDNKKGESLKIIFDKFLKGKSILGMEKEEDIFIRKIKVMERFYKNTIKTMV